MYLDGALARWYLWVESLKQHWNLVNEYALGNIRIPDFLRVKDETDGESFEQEDVNSQDSHQFEQNNTIDDLIDSAFLNRGIHLPPPPKTRK